jgi:Phage P22-like portal protein
MAKLNEKIAREARIAYEKFYASFKQNIDLYHIMHDFVLGQQWTDEEEDDMIKTYRKVPLTSNKLGTMANSLLGEQQQNTPQLQVVPMTGCDEKVASLREIITKDIMFSTSATIAYQVSAGQAAIGGYGAFCLGTDYAHSKSFNQDIEYYYFKDATRCYWDVGAESINKTDGTVCGYLSRMTRVKFRQVYGKETEKNIMKSSSITQSEEEIALAVQPNDSGNPFMWADDESITIIDHYVRKYKKDTLYKLSNGNILNQEEMDALVEKSKKINAEHAQMEEQLQAMQQMQQGGMSPEQMQGGGQQDLAAQLSQIGQGQPQEPQGQPYNPKGFGMEGDHDILPQDKGIDVVPNKKAELMEEEAETIETMTLWDEGEMVRIEEKRPSKKHKIIHYRLAGEYELDKTEFPSEQLPLVFVDNNSYYDKSGKQITRSFFGDCRDTQRYINYLRTQSAYILKVSRYDQWIGSKKNVSSLDTQRNWRDPTSIQGMLTYDESPEGNKPEQVRPPELSASLFQQYELAIQDLYTSTGLYPARMGQSGDEASGAAIDARTRQGSYATFVFFNSINRAVATGGEIANEMIPRVYDSERVMTLMMPDKGIQNVTINREKDEYGESVENDIRKGTYQVRLKPGPSYEGQKEQALQSLREVLKADPTSWTLIADLFAENLPLTNTIEIKNRLKTRVPPQIIEAGKTGEMPKEGGQGPTPEQQAVQLQQQQMQMQHAYQQAQIQIKQQELALKEKQSQAEIEMEKMKLEIAQMELAGSIEEGKMRFMAETGRTQSDKEIAHADNLVKILTHKVQ